MKETKFTNGPWQYTPAGPADSKGMGICAMWGEGEELKANAHLIAASPEMYRIISLMLEQFDTEEICRDEYDYVVIREAKKILAKARGEGV